MELFTPTAGSTIVVGMSGGVDSSVCAALLKTQGYRVIGLFMKNWDETDESGQCPAEQDYADVLKVCATLDIPCYSVNFVKEYWDQVFADTLRQFNQGITPNPDVLCNREIKFKVFFEKAMELGADYLATGHYCRHGVLETEAGPRHLLLKGLDPGKDQTYFLHAIEESVLAKVHFPIGHLQKSEVRRIAHEYDLVTSDKKDSTGICFIGERDFREFLTKYVPTLPGDFRNLDGTRVGQHLGSAFYTLGQRKGLGLGGQGEPWFVVAKDHAKNIVYVERGDDHPALYATSLVAIEPNWLQADRITLPFRCQAKIRYRQADQPCEVRPHPNGVEVIFDKPQRAITPGQSVVFYQNEICQGGAFIQTTRPAPA